MKPSTLFWQYFFGEFNNFQQCWQQHTQVEMHRVDTDFPHRHLHLEIISLQDNGFEMLISDPKTKELISVQKGYVISPPTDDQKLQVRLEKGQIWNFVLKNEVFEAVSDGGECWIVSKNGHQICLQNHFSNDEGVPYRMLKCRFFKGWIEIPIQEEGQEKTHHFGNLRLHDQGGSIQLKMPDGTLGNYTVELTQLIFGRKLPIMKLAIYELPQNALDYNSYAIAYTWTNPEAERLGINLRYILSGWTLDENHLWNSDQT
ncbi:MAG: hypothetical protein ACK4GN_01295 [Runella sp.]